MSNIDHLREIVRAQNLGDSLRRAEFQAILEELAPEEPVLALAPAELRGRQGYLVATRRRVFFAQAGVAGKAVTPITSALGSVRYLEKHDGSVSLLFSSEAGEEILLEGIPKPHAAALARCLAEGSGDGLGPSS